MSWNERFTCDLLSELARENLQEQIEVERFGDVGGDLSHVASRLRV